MAVPLGAILGVVISPIIVSDYTEQRAAEVKGEIEQLLFVHALVVLVLNLPIVFFKEAPEFPPSHSALMRKNTGSFSLKSETAALLKNKNFLIYSVVFSMVYSMYTALGAIINGLIEPYGFNIKETSICMVCLVVSGILSSFATGVLLDKHKTYLNLIRVLNFFTFFGVASTNYTLPSRSFPLLLGSSIFTGIFLLPQLSVGLSFSVEITHPVSEAASTGSLMLLSQVLGVAITFIGTIVANIWPLYAAWMFMGQIFIAFVVSFFLKEDLRRLDMESETKSQA